MTGELGLDSDEGFSRNRQIGVIDIGSNSVRFVIYDLFGAAFTPVYNEKVLAGLGRDLNTTGKLSADGMVRAFKALKRFKYLADAKGLENVLIAATAALRDAEDAPDFIAKVKEEIGFDISPMSGEREAFVSSLGVMAGDSRAHGLAADLGGASLELTILGNGKPKGGRTYPLGPFSVYKGDFNPLEIGPNIDEIFDNSELPQHSHGAPLFLIGGAWRNLALIHQKRTDYPLRIAHNYQIDVAEAKELAEWASGEGAHDLFSWHNLSERRAETLPYAGLLMGKLIEKLKPSEIVISAGGLRDGLLYESLSEELRTRNSLFDACRDLARGRSQSMRFGKPLINFLKDIDPHLPRVFERENETRLRQAACYLVGIGKGLHPDHRAKLSMNSVLHAPIPGLKHKERAYLALMLYGSYTSKIVIPNARVYDYFLKPEEQRAARIFGEAMRFAIVLSGRSAKVLAKQSLGLEDGTLKLKVATEFDGLLVERCLLRLESFAQIAGFDV